MFLIDMVRKTGKNALLWFLCTWIRICCFHFHFAIIRPGDDDRKFLRWRISTTCYVTTTVAPELNILFKPIYLVKGKWGWKLKSYNIHYFYYYNNHTLILKWENFLKRNVCPWCILPELLFLVKWSIKLRAWNRWSSTMGAFVSVWKACTAPSFDEVKFLEAVLIGFSYWNYIFF